MFSFSRTWGKGEKTRGLKFRNKIGVGSEMDCMRSHKEFVEDAHMPDANFYSDRLCKQCFLVAQYSSILNPETSHVALHGGKFNTSFWLVK